VLGGIFATWRGIDGLLIATAILLVIGLVALTNLRRMTSPDCAATQRTDPSSLRSALCAIRLTPPPDAEPDPQGPK